MSPLRMGEEHQRPSWSGQSVDGATDKSPQRGASALLVDTGGNETRCPEVGCGCAARQVPIGQPGVQQQPFPEQEVEGGGRSEPGCCGSVTKDPRPDETGKIQ